jgi:hypothetical protein
VRSRSRIAIACAVAFVVHASPADADPTPADKALATQLFDDAEKLMAASNYAGACAKYAESQRLDPQLGTLLHAADCYEKAGKIASAWASFKEAVEVAARRNASGQKEPREQIARSRAAALETKVSHLMISVTNPDPNLEVLQDDRPVGRAVWGSAFPVDPGPHSVTARAPGHKTWSNNVDVGASGAKVEVVVPPLELEGAPVAPPAPAAPPAPSTAPMPQPQQQPFVPAATYPASPEPAKAETTTGGGSRTAGFVLAGVGVAGIATGIVFGLQRNSKVDERDAICPTSMHCTPDEGARIDSLTNDAKSAAMISNVGFALGGISAALGIYFIVTAKPNEPAKTATVRVQPWTGPSVLGANLGGSW